MAIRSGRSPRRGRKFWKCRKRGVKKSGVARIEYVGGPFRVGDGAAGVGFSGGLGPPTFVG